MVNTYGPQTRGGGGQGEVGDQQRGQIGRDCGNTAIEERLHNIETHLKLPTGQRKTNTQSVALYVVFYVSTRATSSQMLLKNSTGV